MWVTGTWPWSGGRGEWFEQGGDLVVSEMSRGTEGGGVEARLGGAEIRVLGKQEFDYWAAVVGGRPDQRVLDDQLRGQHRT